MSSDKRIPGIDIPTLKEQGVDVEMVNWRGVFAAPGITDAQRAELTSVVERAVKSASWQDTLKRNEWTDVLLTGDAVQEVPGRRHRAHRQDRRGTGPQEVTRRQRPGTVDGAVRTSGQGGGAP